MGIISCIEDSLSIEEASLTDQYNFNKPILSNSEAAAYLCFAPSTLKRSRSTGILAGVDAPPFLRLNGNIRYKKSSLDVWLSQFVEYKNTAQYESVPADQGGTE